MGISPEFEIDGIVVAVINTEIGFQGNDGGAKYWFIRKVMKREAKDCEIKHLNYRAVNLLNSYLAKDKRVLFILAGNDANSSVLLNKFFPKYLKECPHSSDQVRVRIIEQANHIYAWYPWREQLFSLICDWLAEVNQNS